MSFPIGNIDSSGVHLPTTQSLPVPITDQVSIDRAGTSLCGAISYGISEVADPGVTGLTITELTITSSG